MPSEVLSSFTHLEVHSHFTLLGATAPVEALVARAVADGLNYLALTDHQALYGAMAFARACRLEGIQPVTGMTVTVAAPDDTVNAVRQGRLILLAKNGEGYRNLCRLSSWLQGHADRERRLSEGLPWSLLSEFRRGLLCIEAGQRGMLCQLLRSDRAPEAVRYLSRLGGVWQEDAWLGLEIQQPADQQLAETTMRLGKRFGLRAVACQPVYCLDAEERDTLQLLAAIDANCTLQPAPQDKLADQERAEATVHWLTATEVVERFHALPEVVAEIGKVVSRCGDALPDGRLIWPTLNLPEQRPPAEALEAQATVGLRTRYGDEADQAVVDRLHSELNAINRYGFAPLFLVVADIVRFARSKQIPVSTRGSVANSLVAYCLGITTVDPVRHNLLFARFLNPARRNPPDIDLDFCSRQRDRVLDYVRRTYGEERVALVSTMNTLRPRSALRETAKAYGYDNQQIKRLLRQLPRGRWRQLQLEGEEALAAVPDEADRAVVQAALQIVGQPHHLGLHPGGVVITPGPLSDVTPVQWTPKGFVATQYTHEDVEAVGLPKLDLLGIRALTVLADAAELVRQNEQPDFSLEAIADSDEMTGASLMAGTTIGVFQCESEGAQRTLRQLQARCIQDLAVANAFFKPGPAMGGMAQAFIRRYRGEEPVSLLHPALAEILGQTQGILLFQEQVLRVAREIAGLTWAQADRLRRGMSKMRPQAMTALQMQFVEGCQRAEPEGPGMSAEQAQQLWEQVLAFSGYGFNQGHATAYADVSYRSAYIKAHFAAAFLCARLANGGGFYPEAVYIAEAQRLNIAVRPPHVNHSARRFSLTYELQQPVLWMGLGQVRSLRRASVKAIVDGAPFDGLSDLLGRVSLRQQEVNNLIRCGALDGFAESRTALLAKAGVAQRAANPRQMHFDFAAPKPPHAESPAQRVAWEMEILGQPLSVHPMQLVDQRRRGNPLPEVAQLNGRTIATGGVRVPGRTGGPSFLLGDGQGLIMVRLAEGALPDVWKPVRLQGTWRQDQWGGGWFHAKQIEYLEMRD